MQGPIHRSDWDSLVRRIGGDFGTSAWMTITQAMIDAFAEVTEDHYFLHIDLGRAAATAFSGTIAHGMLTLSLLPAMG
ncbi:MAG TPA: MaoC/PaaZ C-terminal domain-containing protein [Burkholderiaceae bacterium]|nr:MaoC/PaaZ C-terminal domain-containing protein [Burkholderiaceae bacterium]